MTVLALDDPKALRKRIARLERQIERQGKKPPKQKRGKSLQDYGTPQDFMAAVRARFGPVVIDLAASAENTVCPGSFITKEEDSFLHEWHYRCGLGRGWGWLNPPFDPMKPWALKCVEEMQKGAAILMLSPAAVGSGWFQKIVRPHAHVIELAPRITFVGETHGYIKDLVLSVFAAGMTGRSYWRWK